MPRQARLDSPGTLHHVIVRGIEKRTIVNSDEDREEFVSRMGEAALATGTAIYAWALLPNHAHMLVRSGSVGLPTFMMKWLTGYRRGRCGFSGFISGGIVMREAGSETTYAGGGPGRFAHVLEHREEPSSRSAGPRDLSELVARKWTADRYGTRAKSQRLRVGRGETVSSGSGPGGSRFCSC